MSQNDSNRSMNFVGMSVAIHAAMVVGVTFFAPEFDREMFPEGTVEVVDIDFTETKAPQGNQVQTMDVGEVEEKAPQAIETKPVKAQVEPEPIIVAKKKTPKKPKKVEPKKVEKVDFQKEVKTETVAESEVPVDLPNKDLDQVTEEYEQEMNKATNEEAVAVAELDEEPEIDPLEEVEDEWEKQEQAEAEVAPVPVPEKPKKVAQVPPAPAKVKKGPQENVGDRASKLPGRKSQSNLAFGVPTGVRDVKDLRQSPGNVPPQYPEVSRLRREMGQVKLMYYVTAQGRVANLKVAKSSGYPNLDNAAVSAISRYRFFPGQEGITSHVVNFNLNGEARPAAGGRLRTSSAY